MMPIILGDQTTIPEECRHYTPLLALMPLHAHEWGQIGYLTIDERSVSETASQRRPGLHIEAPPASDLLLQVSNRRKARALKKAPDCWRKQKRPPLTIRWGRGEYDANGVCGLYNGGIFMLSDVDGSTRVWNAQIQVCEGVAGPLSPQYALLHSFVHPLGVQNPHKVAGPLGSLDHMRTVLGPGLLLVMWLLRMCGVCVWCARPSHV